MTPVNCCKGMTLIELVVAMALGVPVLLMLTSTFASGSRTVTRINEALYFQTEFHELGQLITSDVRRAGYSLSGERSGAVKWPSMAGQVHAHNGCIAYAYEYLDGSAERVRYTTIYRDADSPEVIKYYTKQLAIGEALPAPAGVCKGGESIIDSHLIAVTDLLFNFSGSAVEITLGMKLRDGVYQNSATFNVTVVN